MLSPVAIHHQESRIDACVIQARQPHALQRVTVFATTLCRVRQGEKRLHWADREMRGTPQHMILLPAGQALDITNVPGGQGQYIADAVSFPAAMLRDFNTRHRQQLHAVKHVSHDLCVPLDTHTRNAWEQLLLALRDGAPQALLNLYGEAVLLSLALAGLAAPILEDRHDPLSERLQLLIASAPGNDWTVADAAQQLNLGASTLRRQLTDEGSSFRQILEEVRLGTALLQLQTSARPIGDIAASNGYASASRFSARFRAHYGLSPRDLRAAL